MMTSRNPSEIARQAGVWAGVLTHSASNPAFTLLPMGGSSSDRGYGLGSSILEKPGDSRTKYSISLHILQFGPAQPSKLSNQLKCSPGARR